MSDLRSSLARLREDVAAAPLPTAEAVRRHSDRTRRRRAAALGASVVLAVTGAGALAVATDRDSSRQPAGGGSSAPLPTSAAPPLDRAWLPSPWRLVSARMAPLPGGGAAGRFCGVPEAAGLADVPTQTLAHGSAKVEVHAVTVAGPGDASDLFKRVYAECSARGPVESREGPALYWETIDPDGSAVSNAARWDGATVFLLSTRTASGQPLDATELAGLVAALPIR